MVRSRLIFLFCKGNCHPLLTCRGGQEKETGDTKSHLKVLPAAPAGQVLHNEAVFSANRWPVLIPAGAIPTAVASTFNKDRETNISFKARKPQKKDQTGLKRFTRSLQTEPLLFLFLNLLQLLIIPSTNTCEPVLIV